MFEPSGYPLESLLQVAHTLDFAVLVATPDDTVVSRGVENPTARDNIILEFGLFAGALGRTRTYLLATGELKLPTDVLGLTRLSFRAQSNGRAAVTEASAQVEQQILSQGPFVREVVAKGHAPLSALDKELTVLCANAVSQGWTIKDNSDHAQDLFAQRQGLHALQEQAGKLLALNFGSSRPRSEPRACG